MLGSCMLKDANTLCAFGNVSDRTHAVHYVVACKR